MQVGYEPGVPDDRRPVDDPQEADLVGSLGSDGLHYPCIDIDHPCRLVESETPGHFHLYIDKGIPWGQYVALLDVMVGAGLVEVGYLNATIERGQTFVATKPWKHANNGVAADHEAL